MTTVVGILLAAGFSRRFGANKLLQLVAPGTRMAVRSCTTLRDELERVVAVVRPDQAELATLLAESGAEVIVFPEAERGMGASIAHGVRASPPAGAWLVALADMPWIKPETVRRVTQALELGAPLVIPVHEGRRGHPVGFGAGFRDELCALQGDQGARSILDRHARQLLLLPCDDPGIHRDVDTPQDLGVSPVGHPFTDGRS